MRTGQVIHLGCLVAYASAHGLVTKVVGANGVDMPGLTVIDGTPRDCSSNSCGSQADSAIIRDNEISSGRTGPLGRTQGKGNCDPAVNIAKFMGGGPNKRSIQSFPRQLGSILGSLRGGGGQSTKAMESSIKSTSGEGAEKGLPTAGDDGIVTLNYYQINQDGAGPLSAAIDGTSGGTDAAAFQDAEIVENVPGIPGVGISLATMSNYEVKVKVPEGMTCDASVGGADDVCIVRVRNRTPAGPFGGAGAFTQSATARKRAIEYRHKLKTRANTFKA